MPRSRRPTKAWAKHLAVVYHAFSEASEQNRASGLVTWGGQLLEAQRVLGITLITEDVIEALILKGQREFQAARPSSPIVGQKPELLANTPEGVA